MNLFQLVLKQMRQRALSTCLTLLSVILGSALAIGVLILRRESGNIFVQTDFGYDVIIGAKSSPMQLVLNTVYHVDVSPGNIPYVLYEAMRNSKADVKHAVPYVVGDTYKGYRVAGTTPGLFGFDDLGKPLPGYDDRGRPRPGFKPPPKDDSERDLTQQYAASTFEYRLGRKFTLAGGRMFHPLKFEAVIGADITERTGLKIGDKFKVQHDAPAGAKDVDEHDEQWTVVGVLDKTFTAEDRVIFIPLISFYAIPQHEKALEGMWAAKNPLEALALSTQPTTKKTEDSHAGHSHKHKRVKDPDPWDLEPEKYKTTKPTTTQAAHKHDDDDDHDHDHDHAYHLNPDGTIDLHLTKDKWQLSAILIRSRSPFASIRMQDGFKRGELAMAVNPATEMRKFFSTFLGPSTRVLMVLAILVVITAGVSILVSIYNAVSARAREIAIMRALGATRGKILTLICFEAGLVGLIGGVIGMILGHGLGAIISEYFNQKMGLGINWLAPGGEEWLYLLGIVAVAVLAGLVPGLKAYRTPVATNLVAA